MKHNKLHIDEKILAPSDSGILISKEDLDKHYNKPIRGFAVISNDRTGEVLETPNLVLLSGREFLAQKLADTDSPTNLYNINTGGTSEDKLSNFKIKYFGVGNGGSVLSSSGGSISKIGPFDNDFNLESPQKIYDDSISRDTALEVPSRYQYLHDGYLKRINTDGGSTQIISEAHTILKDGSDIKIDAYTTIKYTMMLRADELFKNSEGAFEFNEAALYAVDYEENVTFPSGTFTVPAKSVSDNELTRYTPVYRTFARFTCLPKWLEIEDSLKIEWYILV